MEFFFKIDPKPEELIGEVKDQTLRARRAGMINAVTALEAEAVKRAPAKTGNLANHRTTDISQDGSQGVLRFTAKYAEYVHEGTGLYGPHKTKIVSKEKITIRSKNGGYLYFKGSDGTLRRVKSVETTKPFKIPGLNHPVHSIKGMKGRPFLTDAAKTVDLAKEYQEGMERYLSTEK